MWSTDIIRITDLFSLDRNRGKLVVFVRDSVIRILFGKFKPKICVNLNPRLVDASKCESMFDANVNR